MAAPPELVANHDAVARADRDLGLEVRVTDREDVLVDVEVVGDDLLLDRRLVRCNLLVRERMRQRVSELTRPSGPVLPPKEAVDDFHVREEVRDGADVRVALDVVEEDRVAPVEVLLDTGELEIAGDRD